MQLLHLLKSQRLLPEARAIGLVLERILDECLAADDEEVVIITDTGNSGCMLSPLMGAGYFLAAEKQGLPVRVVMQSQRKKGQNAGAAVEHVLDESGFRNILILAANALGSTPGIGKSFRKFARARKHKFVSCTSLGSLGTDKLSALMKTVNIDYAELQARSSHLKHLLDKAKEIQITTPAGTDLWLGVSGKESHANDGRYNLPGLGGNLPTGEVYIAPRKKQAEGTIVIDGSSRTITGTNIVRNPIIMRVKEGDVTEIRGSQEAKRLEQSIAWAHENSRHPWGVRRIGEFGIGMNPNASLVGAMIVDEKTMNTAHVAIGSNHWFGGTVYSLIHLDQVMKNPDIFLDGEPLDKQLYSF